MGLDQGHKLFRIPELCSKVEIEIISLIDKPCIQDSKFLILVSFFKTIPKLYFHSVSSIWTNIIDKAIDATLNHNGIRVLPVFSQSLEFILSGYPNFISEPQMIQVRQYIDYLIDNENAHSNEVLLLALSGAFLSQNFSEEKSIRKVSQAYVNVIAKSKDKKELNIAMMFAKRNENLAEWISKSTNDEFLPTRKVDRNIISITRQFQQYLNDQQVYFLDEISRLKVFLFLILRASTQRILK